MNYETIKKINEIAPDAMLSISVKDIIAIVNESKTYDEVGEADGYVDLGLPSGTLWATCNVGANRPEGYGDYFAWGETSPKAEYISENSITYGVLLDDISGNAQYDAATANWGGRWRMPTSSEMQELIDECTWQRTTQNGINGYKITGPNGNSIFLPAAGNRCGSSLNYAGIIGFYWSSTPGDIGSSGACYLSLDSDEVYGSYGYRNYGRTIRPVRSKNK